MQDVETVLRVIHPNPFFSSLLVLSHQMKVALMERSCARFHSGCSLRQDALCKAVGRCHSSARWSFAYLR